MAASSVIYTSITSVTVAALLAATFVLFIQRNKTINEQSLLVAKSTCNPLLESGSSWSYHLPATALQRGVTYKGDACRLQRFRQKLKKGAAVRVVTLGGSVTAGVGVEDKQLSYPSVFFNWIQSVYPNAQHDFIYGGRGATRSNSFAMCLGSFLPRKAIDLVVLEFAQNDEVENVHGLEEESRKEFELLMRGVLRLPGNPAVIVLNHYSWWGYFGGSYYRKNGPRKGKGPEEELTLISQYYGAPVLSLKAAAYPLMAAGVDGFRVDKVEQNDRIMKGEVYGTDWEPFFFFDGYHPNRNGHHALADLLIYLIQQQENDSYDEGNTTCRYGLRGSPPMLIVGNRDAWQCGCLLNPNLFSTFDLPEAEEEPAHAGFTYMAHLPDRALPRDQKWGWTAEDPGAWLEMEIKECKPAINSTSSHVSYTDIGYMRSYENFGKARMTCMGGCRCMELVLDGTWNDMSTQVDISTLKVEFNEAKGKCIVRLDLIEETMSKGHKFVLVYIHQHVALEGPAGVLESTRAWKQWMGI